MLLSAIYAENDKCYLNAIKNGIRERWLRRTAQKRLGYLWPSSAIDALDDLKLAAQKTICQLLLRYWRAESYWQYLNETFVNKNEAKACSKQIKRAFKTIGNLVKEGIVRDEADFTRIGGIGFEATLSGLCCSYVRWKEVYQRGRNVAICWLCGRIGSQIAFFLGRLWQSYHHRLHFGVLDSYMGQTKKIFNKLIDPKVLGRLSLSLKRP